MFLKPFFFAGLADPCDPGRMGGEQEWSITWSDSAHIFHALHPMWRHYTFETWVKAIYRSPCLSAQLVWNRVIQLPEGGCIDQSTPAEVSFSNTPEPLLLGMSRWHLGERVAAQKHICTERMKRMKRKAPADHFCRLSSQFEPPKCERRLGLALAQGAFKNYFIPNAICSLQLCDSHMVKVQFGDTVFYS